MDLFNHVGGPGGILAQLAQMGAQGLHPPARAYDEYLKAYSVAMLPGRERTNVSFGGKIIMPPSALAHLSSLDMASPWMFQLRNPNNSAASTHAGVLEFIADEGVVHLPYWMMKTLRLNEGDPVRITGANPPKGKRVKLQAQTVDFLEISDPKAVLEQALRNFTCLTQGDIVEIHYNSITFALLIMEIIPEGPAICVLDTDLEVDFAPPKGYVEPPKPEPKPQPTMASKLKIDVNDVTPGSSRPGSALGTNSAASRGGSEWEAFRGRGETLNGRKTKGKGVSVRKIEDAPADSRIIRTNKRRLVHTDDLDADDKVPAPLNLPYGKLFFGFPIVRYQPPHNGAPSSAVTGSGSGDTLSGYSTGITKSSTKSTQQEETKLENNWGVGQTLGTKYAAPTQKAKPKPRERSPTPDWGVDDDDVIVIDSD